MINEKCGICKTDKNMTPIESTKDIILYGCGECGNVKDIGARSEDKLHIDYVKDGEPEHVDL
jgi:hypothetical protein